MEPRKLLASDVLIGPPIEAFESQLVQIEAAPVTSSTGTGDGAQAALNPESTDAAIATEPFGPSPFAEPVEVAPADPDVDNGNEEPADTDCDQMTGDQHDSCGCHDEPTQELEIEPLVTPVTGTPLAADAEGEPDTNDCCPGEPCDEDGGDGQGGTGETTDEENTDETDDTEDGENTDEENQDDEEKDGDNKDEPEGEGGEDEDGGNKDEPEGEGGEDKDDDKENPGGGGQPGGGGGNGAADAPRAYLDLRTSGSAFEGEYIRYRVQLVDPDNVVDPIKGVTFSASLLDGSGPQFPGADARRHLDDYSGAWVQGSNTLFNHLDYSYVYAYAKPDHVAEPIESFRFRFESFNPEVLFGRLAGFATSVTYGRGKILDVFNPPPEDDGFPPVGGGGDDGGGIVLPAHIPEYEISIEATDDTALEVPPGHADYNRGVFTISREDKAEGPLAGSLEDSTSVYVVVSIPHEEDSQLASLHEWTSRFSSANRVGYVFADDDGNKNPVYRLTISAGSEDTSFPILPHSDHDYENDEYVHLTVVDRYFFDSELEDQDRQEIIIDYTVAEDRDDATVTIEDRTADIDIAGSDGNVLDENSEDEPGALVFVNQDDDNKDGLPDYLVGDSESGDRFSDNDLVAVSLRSLIPRDLGHEDDYFRLDFNSSLVNLWFNRDKSAGANGEAEITGGTIFSESDTPQTVWLEGIQSGVLSVRLVWHKNAESRYDISELDSVQVRVIGADIDTDSDNNKRLERSDAEEEVETQEGAGKELVFGVPEDVSLAADEPSKAALVVLDSDLSTKLLADEEYQLKLTVSEGLNVFADPDFSQELNADEVEASSDPEAEEVYVWKESFDGEMPVYVTGNLEGLDRSLTWEVLDADGNAVLSDQVYFSVEEYIDTRPLEELARLNNQLGEALAGDALQELTWDEYKALEEAGLYRGRYDGIWDYVFLEIGNNYYTYIEPSVYGAYKLFAITPNSVSIEAVRQEAEFANWAVGLGATDVALSVLPGGTSAGYIEEGDYGRAAAWFAGDVVLTLSLVGKLGQVTAKAGSVIKSGTAIRIGKSLNNIGKISKYRNVVLGASIATGILGAESGVGAVSDVLEGNYVPASIKALDAIFAALGARSLRKQYLETLTDAAHAKKRLAEKVDVKKVASQTSHKAIATASIKINISAVVRRLVTDAADEVFIGVVDQLGNVKLFRSGPPGSGLPSGHADLVSKGIVTRESLGFSIHVKDGKVTALIRNSSLNKASDDFNLPEGIVDKILMDLPKISDVLVSGN